MPRLSKAPLRFPPLLAYAGMAGFLCVRHPSSRSRFWPCLDGLLCKSLTFTPSHPLLDSLSFFSEPYGDTYFDRQSRLLSLV